MYLEKMESILDDLENKEIEVAGGAVVGMVLSTVNSLIIYISNLTIGNERYKNVQNDVVGILNNANKLKNDTLQVIDKDKEILEEILVAYKSRKENEDRYILACKKSTDFCMKVLELAYETMELSDKISKVGNKMLESDFKICKYYAIASVRAAIENVYINVENIEDKEYKEKIKKYRKIHDI